MKGSYLSITEMAKLRNISSETLRYYDRIGLLKPDFVDPDTKYRYYSVLQSEKLGTIRELRSLGMSVEEVKDYFDGCHLQKSIKILSSHYSKLEADIERKLFLCQVIMRKLSFLGGPDRFEGDRAASYPGVWKTKYHYPWRAGRR